MAKTIILLVALALAAIAGVTAVDVTGPIRDPAMVVGGKKIADLEEEGVKAAAAAAVQHIENQSNSVYTYKLMKIVDARKQVVAGVKYHLTLEAAPTSCLKDGSNAEEGCAVNVGRTQRYHVQVLSQPWKKPGFSVNIGEIEEIN